MVAYDRQGPSRPTEQSNIPTLLREMGIDMSDAKNVAAAKEQLDALLSKEGVLSDFVKNNSSLMSAMHIKSAGELREMLQKARNVLHEKAAALEMIQKPENKGILRRGFGAMWSGVKSVLNAVKKAGAYVLNFPRKHPVLFTFMLAAVLLGLGAWHMGNLWDEWGKGVLVPDASGFISEAAREGAAGSAAAGVPLNTGGNATLSWAERIFSAAAKGGGDAGIADRVGSAFR